MAILLVSALKRKISKMSKINVSQWKKFKLTELFEPHHGKRLTKRNRVPGEIPFLTAGFDNQGVKGYLAGNFEIWHNPISIDMFGNCFYHECDCTGDDNVYALVNNAMTSNVKLFIAGVLNKQLSIQFSYKDQFRQHDLDVLSIKLPADSAGNPDWHYMDEYIAKLATQAHTNISLLRQQQRKAPTFNIDRWKEFSLSHLFHAEFTDGDNKPNRLLEDDDGHPLIGATSECFGCVGYYQTDTKVFPAKSLTWDRFGHCFVQPKSFQTMAHGNVMVLKPKMDHSYEALLFVASIINRISQMRDYGYGRTLTLAEFKRSTIKLPVDLFGHPDWQYMDKYISSIQQAQKERVARLTSIVKK